MTRTGLVPPVPALPLTRPKFSSSMDRSQDGVQVSEAQHGDLCVELVIMCYGPFSSASRFPSEQSKAVFRHSVTRDVIMCPFLDADLSLLIRIDGERIIA